MLRAARYVVSVLFGASIVIGGADPAFSAGKWLAYSGPNFVAVATANVANWLPNGVPPSTPGLMCGVLIGQAFINCYTPTGSLDNPQHSDPIAVDSGSVFVNGSTTQLIQSMTMVGIANEYVIYALRADGNVYWRGITTPVSQASVGASWNPSVTNDAVKVRQIAYAHGIGVLGVGADSRVYRAFQGHWILYSNVATVALFGGDNQEVAPLVGSSGTSTTFGAVIGYAGGQLPPAREALPLANVDSNVAFLRDGKITPIACDAGVGCFALGSSNLNPLGQFEPSIYRTQPNSTSWVRFDTDNTNTNFSSTSGPWSIATGALYRPGANFDLLMVGGSFRLYEWVQQH